MTALDPSRMKRALELFDRVVDLPLAERSALLRAECAGETDLIDVVSQMLEVDAQADPIDLGAAATAGDLLDEDDEDASGESLGQWRLDCLLGRGGMGEVYAATRQDDSAQRAAIKRLRRRWDGSVQAQRFLAERRILATLSHPNLPAFIDHGVDGEGRPWFALEYIDGQTLTEWADTRRLGLRERLDLFRQVCAGVQHAHERFIVHRDLKPANILVDRIGRVRVLDFGAAKRLDATEGRTRTGLFAGFTPEYAAPEQISGGAITAATDVHALGVILYQLLSGQLPYVFAGNDLRAAAEAIGGKAAVRMEQAISSGGQADMRERLANRATDLRGFRRFVRGDLGRILQTALAKEPERRYATVQRLSDDLGRFLRGHTVSVTGDTWRYRARKFVWRNRWGVGMAAMAVLTLLVSAAYSNYQAAAEREQRQRTEAVLAFFTDMFTGKAAEGGYGPKLTAMQLLDRAAGRLDTAFPNDPLGKAELLVVVANTYNEMGHGNKGVFYGRRAVAVARPYRQRKPEIYLRGVVALAEALGEVDFNEELIALADRELPLARLKSPLAAIQILRQSGIARNDTGDVEHAEHDLREAIALAKNSAGVPSQDLTRSYSNLAQVLSDKGDPGEALELFRKVQALESRDPTVSPFDRLITQYSTARELFRLGQLDEARVVLERALPRFEALVGGEHERVAKARSLLAQVYAAQGRYNEAAALSQRNLDIQRASADIDQDEFAISKLVQAKLLVYAGHSDAALLLAQDGMAWIRKQNKSPSVVGSRAQWVLGEAWLGTGHCDRAVPLFEAALRDARAVAGEATTANAGEALDSLGRCRLLQGDAAGAQALLTQAVAQFSGALGADNMRTLRSDIHRLWAAHVRGDASALPALRLARVRLEKALGNPKHPVLKQLDLLIAALPAKAMPAGFLGLTSFS